MRPSALTGLVASIINEVGIQVEMHTHNDFGLATANALAGLEAGARFMSTTVMGIGERTGNSPLEEVAMGAKHLYGIDPGIDMTRILEVVEYVARAAGRDIPAWKPIVGTNCFAHEAGIHTDGVMKSYANYEPYLPEEVGATRRIVIGKHSGRSTVRQALAARGVEVPEDMVAAILEDVRATSVALKRSLTEQELFYIYQDRMGGTKEG